MTLPVAFSISFIVGIVFFKKKVVPGNIISPASALDSRP